MEKLKDLAYVHEYAVSKWFDMLRSLEDPIEMWDIFKLTKLPES